MNIVRNAEPTCVKRENTKNNKLYVIDDKTITA